MNIAIIISISDYDDNAMDLPGCVNDGKLMELLLEASGKFSKVFTIIGKSSAAELKVKLVELVREFSSKDVEEVFFYYSGHGSIDDGDFHYLLSDYSDEKLKQTSLENAELDQFLRNLSPDLVTKVIDACHSGVLYIKSDTSITLDSILRSTIPKFKNCYFMYSSDSEQLSYQNSSISFFTRSFLTAVANFPGSEIRYKDITSSISDDFRNKERQKPQFVIQADLTETFIVVTDELKNKVLSKLMAGEQDDKNSSEESPRTLKESVETDATNYCTEEEAYSILSNLKNQIENHVHNIEALEIFEVDTSVRETSSSVPGERKIAKWIYDNPNRVFASARTEPKEVTVYPNPLSTAIANFASTVLSVTSLGIGTFNSSDPIDPSKPIRKTIQVPIDYFLATNQPFSHVMVTAKPRTPNLSTSSCVIVPLISMREIVIFSGFVSHTQRGWNSDGYSNDVQMTVKVLELKDREGIVEYIDELLNQFWRDVLDPIHKKFGLSEKAVEGEAFTEPEVIGTKK